MFAVVSLFLSCWTVSQGAKVNARASSRWVWFGLFLVGLFLLLLGYAVLIPIAVSISIGGIASRVNSAATLGAALALSSLFKLGSEIASSRRWLASLIFLVLMSGSIGLASAHHYTIWQDYANAWQIQKGIWRSMFTLAPSFADDSYVLITGLPRPQGIMSPLNAVWEVTAALRLLYDNQSLRGDVLWEGELGGIGQDAAEYRIRFLPDGFTPRRSEEIISYEHLVLFEFVPPDGLRLIEGAPPWAPPSIPALRTNPAQVKTTPSYSPARGIIGL
ncbi:MAG: hypothetical protein H5T64_04370 [Chloroflexi bacterium]|nr:hypothetical protein [Chloroflexota bacterium]